MRQKSRLPGPPPNLAPASPSASGRLVRDIRRVTRKHHSPRTKSELIDRGRFISELSGSFDDDKRRAPKSKYWLPDCDGTFVELFGLFTASQSDVYPARLSKLVATSR